jgi:diguanylate cyclase (GGDEF)-like protein
MYKQLWLAIICSILLALTGSLLASMLSARSYLEAQLTMKNSDNATALALSLSQQQPDQVLVELAVSALFDSGHYQSIEVLDPSGIMLISRVAPEQIGSVPGWFTRLLPIAALPGEAMITGGWTQFGSIILRSKSNFAYEALWQSAIEMALAALLAGVVGSVIGSQILGRLRKPLQSVINQALAITERRFVTIEEPAVPELSQLAGAMNSMVGRLKSMFDEEARKLDILRFEANCDPLTGLANRDFFLGRLRSLLQSDDFSGGALLIIRVTDLVGINRRLGRASTDQLLQRVGAVAQKCVQGHGEGIAGRLNGADFAILLAGSVKLREIAEQLLATLVNESASYAEHGQVVCLGIGVFPHGIEPAVVLSHVDTALAAAEADGNNSIREANIAADFTPTRNTNDWSNLISTALEQRRVRLISFPVAAAGGDLMHQECPLRLKLEEHGEWLPAGHFLPMAERLKLTEKLDLAAVELGLIGLAADASLPGLAINLSASSLEDPDFVIKLKALLTLHAREAGRFWLEVSETGALRHFAAFKILVQMVKASGCHIGIEHFGRQFSQIGLFHQLGLDYIKVDTSFVSGIQDNSGNQAFLKGLTLIAHSIGLLVIAEGVTTEAELKTLTSIGFDGATGPFIR